MSLVHVSCHGVDGSLWELGTREDSTGVVLGKPNGLVARTEVSTEPRADGRGVVRRARTFPGIEGSLELLILSDRHRGMTLDEVYWGFTDAFSTDDPARLRVVDSHGTPWWLPVFLGDLDPAETAPTTPGLRRLPLTLPLWSEEGLWAGEARVLTGSTVTVVNRGQLPLFPTVRWSGSGRTVTLPGGLVVALPAVTGYRRLSTNPGTGYKITRDDGTVDVDAWSAMRGLAVYGHTAPRSTAEWGLSTGVELHVLEHTRNPWR